LTTRRRSIGDSAGLVSTLPSGFVMTTGPHWDLEAMPRSPRPEVGQTWAVNAGDVFSSAPELARLTLNVAHVHHDQFSQPTGALVYGGHTIGLALAQLTRNMPNVLTVAGWHSCDHLGPVCEGDTLISTIEVTDVSNVHEGLLAVSLRVRVSARRGGDVSPVLAWRLAVILT